MSRLQEDDALRRGVLIGSIILVVVLLILGIGLIWKALAPARPGTPEAIEAASPDEFLVIVALFDHKGGERYYVGAELVNDLRQTPHVAGAYRVERLDTPPREKDIPQLMADLNARILITGWYDEQVIEAQVYFVPPPQSPPLPQGSDGPPVHFFGLAPTVYRVYAPRGIGHPFQYLQYGIIGQSHFWRGEYTNAQHHFNLAQQMLPAQVPLAYRHDMDRFTAALLWYMGYVAGPVQGKWDASHDAFYRSLTLDASALPSILGLAQALTHLNQPERAIDLLQAALRENPNVWQVYFALAEIKGQQGRTEEALALFDKAISLLSVSSSPQDQQALADVYFYRGYYFYQLGDYESALSDYETARSLGKEDVYLLSNLGWTAYLLGDYETAVEASSQAAALDPTRPELQFNKGLHLLAAGRYDEAKQAYDQAIQLTLTYDDVLTRSTYFGRAYYDLEDLAQRRPDLQPEIQEIQQQIDQANG